MAQIEDKGSTGSSDKITLSLNGETVLGEKNTPYMGYAAVVLGIIGIPFGSVFTIIGLICSFIALFMGQISLAIIGIFLGLAGVLTSPVLMGLIGLTSILAWFS